MDAINIFLRHSRAILLLTISNFVIANVVLADEPMIQRAGSAITFNFSNKANQLDNIGVDFQNARPMPLPAPARASGSESTATLNIPRIDASKFPPGSMPGSVGNGRTHAIQLNPGMKLDQESILKRDQSDNVDAVVPQQFGTSEHVFTTSRIDPYGVTQVARFYPYSAAGKLFFKKGVDSFVCSASLIRPGIVVTAAHCAVNWGQQQVYSQFAFAPGYYNGAAPFGVWTVGGGAVLSSYFNGTPQNCTPDGQGVVCNNDVVVLVLNPQFPEGFAEWAGDWAGWLGYAWNGWGYNSQYLTLISELGYPVNLDSGALMQRTDSQGYVDFSQRTNTIIGSLQTGGSSGGPWILNLGIPPSLSNVDYGFAASPNMVVAVTSWGYIDSEIKQQGASAFTSNNILTLINVVCPTDTGPCHP